MPQNLKAMSFISKRNITIQDESYDLKFILPLFYAQSMGLLGFLSVGLP